MVFLKLFLYPQLSLASQVQPKPPPPCISLLFPSWPFFFTWVIHPLSPPPPLPPLLNCPWNINHAVEMDNLFCLDGGGGSCVPYPTRLLHPCTPSHDLRRKEPTCAFKWEPPSLLSFTLYPALFPPIIISGVSDRIRCCLLLASCGTLLQHPPNTYTHTYTHINKQTQTP